MADIFISYSSQDKTIVKQVAGLLEDKGWSVWWDRQIPIGQKYDTVIENELQNAGCVVVIWTNRSVASEWVKNEALEAAGKNKLVPVMLEQVNLPLAFKRIEAAMLLGWNGEDDHPELEMLYQSIENILHPAPGTATGTTSNSSGDGTVPLPDRKPLYINLTLAVAGIIAAVLLAFYYLRTIKVNNAADGDHRGFYFVLILFGISVSTFVYGLLNSYSIFKNGRRNIGFAKTAGPAVGLALILLGAFFLAPKTSTAKTITIRVFDWKKNPLSQGDVKIYLQEYIRTQSIDKMGQALFTGIPREMAGNKMKIEVSSPGYTTRSFDTALLSSKPLELVLPLTTVVLISGVVTTADERPVAGVELNVDGTRYYALSITNGTFNLRLEEYTLGDEITITTSHKDYEDKTTSFKITAPEIRDQHIVLNPVHH